MELSKGQTYALLACVRLLESICSIDTYCSNMALGVGVSTALQVLIVLAVYRLPVRLTNVLGRAYCTLYALITVFRVVTLDGILPNGIDALVGYIVLLGVCIYCANLGVKAITRSALIVGGIVGISLVVVLIGLLPDIHLSYLSKTLNGGSVLHYTLNDLLHSVDLVFLLKFGLPKTSAFKYLGIKFLALEVLTLVSMSTLAGVTVVSKYPLLELATYSQPFDLQRCDVLYTLVATLTCVLNVSIAVYWVGANPHTNRNTERTVA